MSEAVGNAAKASAAASPPTPLSLLERVRANEPEAWRRLYDLYQPLIRFWCARAGLTPEDSADVTQEVFTGAVRGLAGFRRERPGDTFRGWLRGITRNQILLWRRRQQGKPTADGGSDALWKLQQVEAPFVPSEDDEALEISQLYRRALDQVRVEFQEGTWLAFWLTLIEGRAPAALSKELGMSVASIRQAKSRVLRRIKLEVGDLID